MGSGNKRRSGGFRRSYKKHKGVSKVRKEQDGHNPPEDKVKNET